MTQESKDKTLVCQLDDMSCTSCANTIEKNLNTLPGIKNATINFATEKAHITFDGDQLDESIIINKIKDLGYGAKVANESSIERITVKVTGMTCTACSSIIEKTLNKKEGIQKASINFAAEKLTLSYYPHIIRLSDISKIVDDLGYQIILEDDASEVSEFDRDEMKVKEAFSKMRLSVVLSSIMMILMMVHMFLLPIPGYLAIVALLGFPIIFINGRHVHIGTYKALKNKSPNMDTLVTLGSMPPYIVGLLGFFFDVQTFIEMASTIMTFHLIGKYLEVRAKGRASQAIKKLIQMGAKTARILIDGQEVEVPTKDLQPGDIMVIRPGEKIPTDGIVVEGYGLLDESMATGESIPVRREVGQEVIGATINKQGFLQVKVTKVGHDTFLSQVIKLMEECQGSKVPIQEFSDRITGYFVPAIILITIGTFISFNVFSDFHYRIVLWGSSFLPWINPDLTPLTLAFITATAVLVISCPCALGLGTPTALMVGSGMGAEKGILIRNGEAIQTFKDLAVIAFDKTGTITKGKPEVTDIITSDHVTDEDFLYWMGSIEKGSEHPLAFAILEKAKDLGISLDHVSDFEAMTGKGVKGFIEGHEILAGNRSLMTAYQVNFEFYEDTIVKLEEEAKTVMLLAKDKKLMGLIAVSDPIKEDSVQGIALLNQMGIVTAMITGDNQRTANAIAKKVGIQHVIAEVLPDGKVNEVENLQKRYGVVAMVGDGINDAPALKQANIGIAIGTGTDIAIEAADVTLVRGELSGIVSAIKLSRAIFRKIKENYFWAWIYNAVFIPVAVMGLLHPLIGAAAMAMSSLNVVYNSLRLKKKDISPDFSQLTSQS